MHSHCQWTLWFEENSVTSVTFLCHDDKYDQNGLRLKKREAFVLVGKNKEERDDM